jgi:hypothetical protein
LGFRKQARRKSLCKAEIEVFEAWFGDVFDELFGAADRPKT